MNRVASAGEVLVVLNCGSSSIKFAVFDATADPLPRKPVWNGKVQGIGGAKPDFGETGVVPFAIELDGTHPYRSALALIRERILARLDGRKHHPEDAIRPRRRRSRRWAVPRPRACRLRTRFRS